MTRAIALLLGLGLVMVIVLAGQVAGGHGPLGSSVTFTTGRTGELDLSRTGPILIAPNMNPGPEAAAARGSVMVRNQTARTLAVRLRALPELPDLDRLLLVRVQVGNSPPLVAALGDLRRWSPQPFVLRSGEERQLTLHAWLPSGLRAGYQSRVDEIELELEGSPVAA